MRELRQMIEGNHADIESGQQLKVPTQKSQREQQQQTLNASNSTTKYETSMTSTPVYNQQGKHTFLPVAQLL